MQKKILFFAVFVICFFSITAALHADSGNFQLVVQGQVLSAPIDLKRLDKSIRLSLAQNNWRLVKEVPGELYAHYEKSGGVVSVDIRIKYSDSGYTLEYVDSKGLDANLKRKTIHRNYPRWIAAIDRAIYTKYLE